jgi:hypothetical protein
MRRWEQSLASQSEAIVKAEQMTMDMGPEELQRITLEAIEAGRVSWRL